MKLIISFKNAFRGIFFMLKQERNARIHLVVLFLVVLLGFYMHISVLEWLAIVLASGMVIALETVNTALERLCDRVNPEFDEQIRRVKDMSAAAVLTATITAVVIGLIVFIPKLF